MRRIIMVLTVALVMAAIMTFSAGAALAIPMLPDAPPAEADCGMQKAEDQAPAQGDEGIPILFPPGAICPH